MHKHPKALAAAAFAIVLGSAAAQSASVPKISARQFVSGSAMLTVRGAVQIEQSIPLNTAASLGDGEMTWLQFGDSGSASPNVAVTVSPYEVGVSVGRGRFVATGGFIPGEPSQCSGQMSVTASAVSGRYECRGVTSHDPGASGTGEVDIDIRFDAKS